jgi:hypothetical protein
MLQNIKIKGEAKIRMFNYPTPKKGIFQNV